MQNVGQIVGFAAMAVSMLIYLQRKRKNILILKLSSDVLWALHHLMILSYTAALTTAIAIFREIVFYNYDKKWAKSRWWSVGFSLVFVMAALFTWKDAFSIIPAIGTVLTTVAFGEQKNRCNKAVCGDGINRYALLRTALSFLCNRHKRMSYANIDRCRNCHRALYKEKIDFGGLK